MTIDIRAAQAEKVSRQDKAMKWLYAHAVDRKVTDIGRMASHLKLRKDEAIQVIRELIDGYGFSQEWTLGTVLAVFVPVNQLPDWLRPMLSGVQVVKVLQNVRKRRNKAPSRTYRTTLLKLLSANLPNLRADVFKEHQENETVVIKALNKINECSEITQGQLEDNLTWIDTMKPFGNLGGAAISHITYKSGFEAIFDFACHTYEMLDALNFSRGQAVNVKYRPRRDEETSAELEEVRGHRMQLTRSIIDEFANRGMQLIGVGSSMGPAVKGKSKFRCSLIFVRNTTVMSMVRLNLPWNDFMVEIDA